MCRRDEIIDEQTRELEALREEVEVLRNLLTESGIEIP